MSSLFGIDRVRGILREKELIEEISLRSSDKLIFGGIATDSRRIKSGDIFICIKGFDSDGNDFAEQAVNKGAKLLITEQKPDFIVDYILVKNSRHAACWLCKDFYQIDDDKIKLIGITGTNGKTTTAWLMYQLTNHFNISAGYIGTIGCYYNDVYLPTALTTPDIVEISELMSVMQKAGIRYVFLEVSSHALYMQRLTALSFTMAMFLNLSQDHLDFHNDLADYAETKFQLFELLKQDGVALINQDDKFGIKLWNSLDRKKISVSNKHGDIYYNYINLSDSTSVFTLTINETIYEFSSNLKGKFNIQNLSFAIGGFSILFPDIDLNQLKPVTQQLTAAPGRLEKVDNPQELNIFIDYAHTPEAISKVTKALAEIASKRLITLIGAGGNRDKGKRPLMLNAAQRNSDIVIVTTDNPRYENPLEIISDMLKTSDRNKAIWIKEDRTSAIEDALLFAAKGDTILICGKGHEKYQEIKGIKYPFDDRDVIKRYFDSKISHKLHYDRIMLEYVCNGSISLKNNQRIKAICTDTRSLAENSLFIALEGENYNGHDFIPDALSNSSCIALSNKNYHIDNERVIQVDNTLKSYGLIARNYRKLLNCKIIAVTGSVGKTSLKERLSNLLEIRGNTARTYSNENNYIGVPKTLLNIKPTDKYAVVELGTNKRGEIDWLASITCPDIAIITNIGASHLEYLKSEEGVFREKINIFSYNPQVKIFPGDDTRFEDLEGIRVGKSIDCDYQIRDISATKEGYSFLLNKEPYQIQDQVEYQVTNTAFAIAAATQAGLTSQEIKQGLTKKYSLPLRMEIIETGKVDIIADCYNANPQSMEAAINFWSRFKTDKAHILILGSMLELGTHSQELHNKIGEMIKTHSYSFFISVGEEAEAYHAPCKFKDVAALIESKILDKFPEEAVILIKGSHSIHLEKLLKRYNKFGIF